MAQIEPLLVMLKALGEQIKADDRRLEEIARADAVVQRLCSVPGVGPVVATTFASTLDDSSRFLGAKHVRSYLGLVPREYSSGERQHRVASARRGACAHGRCWWRRPGRCCGGRRSGRVRCTSGGRV